MTAARRRLLLMRHGAVDYFDRDGRPYPQDQVELTAAGVAQARAVGGALRSAGVAIDRVVTSGLPRTVATAGLVLAEAGCARTPEHWEALREIRAGHLASIGAADLHRAFVRPFEGPVTRDVRFLNGETIGALLDRVLPALQGLLAAADWDCALLVLHGGVNCAILSWFLTGQAIFLGGLAQDAGCLNIIDVGTDASTSIVRAVNLCLLEPLRTETRLSTMEVLLQHYLRSRRPADNATSDAG